MKAIKKINNNVAVCVDNNNNQLIAFGSGIGFPDMPYEIEDLELIEMTFYRLNEQLYSLLNEIPEEIFEISAKVVTRARKVLKKSLNPNVVFSLADHINFSIERMTKYQKIKLAFSYDIEQLYPLETELGRYAVELIQKNLYVSLPVAEVTTIALHFVNAEDDPDLESEENQIEELISESTNILESDFDLVIEKDGFNYNRFVMHLRYFIKRVQEGKQFIDKCDEMLMSMKESFPEVYQSAKKVASYIDNFYDVDSTNDEILYLMIHINRMINKER